MSSLVKYWMDIISNINFLKIIKYVLDAYSTVKLWILIIFGFFVLMHISNEENLMFRKKAIEGEIRKRWRDWEGCLVRGMLGCDCYDGERTQWCVAMSQTSVHNKWAINNHTHTHTLFHPKICGLKQGWSPQCDFMFMNLCSHNVSCTLTHTHT